MPFDLQVNKYFQNFKKWLKSERNKKFEIESKFRINDSSKLLTDTLDSNVDFYVSVKNSNIDPTTLNQKPKVRNESQFKLYSNEEMC